MHGVTVLVVAIEVLGEVRGIVVVGMEMVIAVEMRWL